MRQLMKIISIMSFLISVFIALSTVSAQESPVTTDLVVPKASFQEGEKIPMQIFVYNNTQNPVIAHEGFLNQDFHLMITFIGPDGNPINAVDQQVGYEGGPPYRSQDRDAVFVEIIPVKDPANTETVKITIIDDARAFYNLSKPGRYTAKVYAYLETFSQSTFDADTGRYISFLDDRSGSYNIASNEVSFEILPLTPRVSSSIKVTATLYKIEAGTKPKVQTKPIENLKVHLIKRSSAQEYEPIKWKVYPLIWHNIDPFKTQLTNAKGVAVFEGIPRDDYILLTAYEGIYQGALINTDDPFWTSGQLANISLDIMQRVDNKKIPTKTKALTGSMLKIIEPEYIEWDGTKELYPFVFESLGDWGVTTSITLPEGFVADFTSLNAQVKDEIEAVQFTITDIGSLWGETNVTYTVTHKKKPKTLKSKVGIKLSKKLAQQKGKGIFGDTENPGTFQGGKRVE